MSAEYCCGLCCDAAPPQIAQDFLAGIYPDDVTCGDCLRAIDLERRARSYDDEPEYYYHAGCGTTDCIEWSALTHETYEAAEAEAREMVARQVTGTGIVIFETSAGLDWRLAGQALPRGAIVREVTVFGARDQTLALHDDITIRDAVAALRTHAVRELSPARGVIEYWSRDHGPNPGDCEAVEGADWIDEASSA